MNNNQYNSPYGFECPFSPSPADDSDFLNRDSVKWLQSLGVDKDRLSLIESADFGGFSARVHYAFPPRKKSLLHRFNLFLFLWDDLVDEDCQLEYIQRLHNELNSLARSTTLTKTTTTASAALQDILKEVQPSDEFCKVMSKTIESAAWQIANKQSKQIPSIEEYWEKRFWFSGLPLILSVANLKIPNVLIEKINTITCTTNDIFSYEKERRYNDCNNSIFLRTYYQGVSVKQAIKDAIIFCNQETKRLSGIVRSINDELTRFWIQDWIAGNLEWHHHSPRYSGAFGTRKNLLEAAEEMREENLSLKKDLSSIEKIETSLPNLTGQQILGMALENLPIVVFSIDENWLLQLAEGEGLKQLYPNEKRTSPNIGRSVLDLYHEYPETLEAINKCLNGEPQIWNSYLRRGAYEVWGFPLEKSGGMLGLAVNMTEHYSLLKKSKVILKRHQQVKEDIRLLFELFIAGTEILNFEDYRLMVLKWKKLLDILIECFDRSGLAVPIDRLIIEIGQHLLELGYLVQIDELKIQKNIEFNKALMVAILIGEICWATKLPTWIEVDAASNLKIQIEKDIRSDSPELGAIAEKLIGKMKAVRSVRPDKLMVAVGL